QFGSLIALLNYGLRFVPSGRAALICATFRLLTSIVAAALGRERLTPAKLSGVSLTILGVALALGEKTLQRGASDEVWIGELAVLASALSGAVCSVLYRPYLEKYPTLPVSAFAMLASVAFLAPLPAGPGLFSPPLGLPPGGWLPVVFSGLSSGGGYYLWLWALNHAPATQVTAFLSLSPVTAAALGAWLLGEPVSPLAALGLLAVVAGLALTHVRSRRAPALRLDSERERALLQPSPTPNGC